MGELIQFPRKEQDDAMGLLNPVDPDNSIKNINENMDMIKHYHINETIENVAPILFNNLNIAGFSFTEEDDEKLIKDSTFLIETLKSMLNKYHGLHHPFQAIAEAVYYDDPEDDNIMKMNTELSLKLEING